MYGNLLSLNRNGNGVSPAMGSTLLGEEAIWAINFSKGIAWVCGPAGIIDNTLDCIHAYQNEDYVETYIHYVQGGTYLIGTALLISGVGTPAGLALIAIASASDIVESFIKEW